MSETYHITSHCTIRNGVFNSSHPIDRLKVPSEELGSWLLEAYNTLGGNYPKFHKMDTLCKLGFIASEIVLKPVLVQNLYEKKDIAVILANSVSSLDSDLNYVKTISDPENYFPSPVVFVYTLPNIVIGEICIRNKFMGENAFFISEKFDAALFVQNAETLLDGNFAKACLVGWVDVLEGYYEASSYFVEKADTFSNFDLNIANLNNLYRP